MVGFGLESGAPGTASQEGVWWEGLSDGAGDEGSVRGREQPGTPRQEGALRGEPKVEAAEGGGRGAGKVCGCS